MTRSSEKGFTLVELSIVLVIIGLIVGGVLVGQDLIKAAQIRAVVTQLQQYDSAVNTFRTKYSGIPGDLLNADTLILNADASSAGVGNGLLDDSVNSAGDTSEAFDNELALFWQHLSLTNLIPGNYSVDTATATVGVNFPETKLKKGGLISYMDNGLHYYYLGISENIDGLTITDSTPVNTPIMSPIEAFGIDNKIDDGDGDGGQIRVMDNLTTPAATLGTASTDCINTDGVYNLVNEQNLCIIRVRMSI